MKSIPKSKIRIIAGNWRNHNLEFLDLPDIRPTPNRLRETLFNMLTPKIHRANCLDLFAGSGVMGFEAVSRGAAHATLIDSDRQICKQIRHEVDRLATRKITVVNNQAQQFIASCQMPYDIIFLDPPFSSDLLAKTLRQLAENACILTDKTTIYIEHKINSRPLIPQNWQSLRQFKAAQVACELLVARPQIQQ